MKVRSLFVTAFTLTFLLTTSSFKAETYITIHVKITNIRNTDGRIQLQIYKDNDSFKKEDPAIVKLITKEGNVKGGIINYDLKLPAGKYGLALLDDENRNTKMDYGMVMPKEGFGFSDYYHTAWSKPVFSDFSFDLKAEKNVLIKIRYV